MLLSMTGFGRSTRTYKDKTIIVEIRSLNSKFTDMRFKIPQLYRSNETDFRKMVTERSERGKIDINIEVKSMQGDDEYALNNALFKKYYQELTKIADEIGMDKGDLMQAILKLPNVVTAASIDVEKEELDAITLTLSDALDNFTKFRQDEGFAMEEDSRLRIKNIIEALHKLEPHEGDRVEKIKKRMLQHLDEYVGQDNIDANRFEQEVLYYLEKIDITEEKVRLEQHCKYFVEELDDKKTMKGRKLSFISQEMGREINTLGSKAYSSDIQRFVVMMKDELEKIKELVANAV